MNLSALFFSLVGVAVALNFLDWYKTVGLIKQFGLKSEKNFVMRFFFGKSKWLALVYKMWVYPLLVYAGYFHAGGDVQNVGVSYVDGPGKDYWGIGWILAAILAAGVGAYGYFKSGVKK